MAHKAYEDGRGPDNHDIYKDHLRKIARGGYRIQWVFPLKSQQDKQDDLRSS